MGFACFSIFLLASGEAEDRGLCCLEVREVREESFSGAVSVKGLYGNIGEKTAALGRFLALVSGEALFASDFDGFRDVIITKKRYRSISHDRAIS